MKMRKTILTALMAFILAMGSFGLAFADSASWNVTFNSNKQMVSDYDQNVINAKFRDMQPGDDLTLDVSIKNESAESTDWYMTSTVFETLRDINDVTGGAYVYTLSYNGNELYNSETVGGDNWNGLREVDDATGSWLHVATLAPGQSGTVQLYMALDGMTQENVYQTRTGGLQIKFAVEDAAQPNRVIVGGDLPQTGDLLTDILMFAICALLVALTALSFYKDRTKTKVASSAHGESAPHQIRYGLNTNDSKDGDR